MDTKQPIIITAKHRGVFFGFADPTTINDKQIRLVNARNCIAWKRSVGGVFGLAQSGPDVQCSIGAVMPAITLRDITAVIECTPVAAKAWEDAPCVS